MANELITVGHITARTVQLEVIRQVDSFRYDWDDGLFKNAGWVERLRTMTEDGTTAGRYTTSVDPATWSTGRYELVAVDTVQPQAPLIVSPIGVLSGMFRDALGLEVEGIRQGTAYANFPFFMRSASDHITPATGLTGITATRSLDGGALTAMANTPLEIGRGWYRINLAAADTNGVMVTYIFEHPDADDCPISFKTSGL
jgi:hypothetical protein